ncbi:hypothetical protein [Polyangium aurulentum]|uniref:hypothetical protein n=1 Tax=Polyangium aurulentum TaxID=2567896 RepID=UPI0010AE8241|nr:hypothetical protein [Polyangium aurulentum]UQA57136.1 hypothetical protein E8A73_038475 [Polyangium aurulentum]
MSGAILPDDLPIRARSDILGDMGRLAGQAAGISRILGMSRGKGLSARVRHELRDRQGITTILHYLLLDASDTQLAEGSVEITPDADVHVGRTLLEVPMKTVQEHRVWGVMLEIGEVVVLRWRLELRDASGTMLARKTIACEYRAPF